MGQSVEAMRVLDLCTEFASETAAFRDRGHEVVTLGIEGKYCLTSHLISTFPSIDDKYDFVVVHPPCPEFSLANYRLGACKDRHPDMSILWACQRIIATLEPKYSLIENPKGCMRHFIGKPDYTINYSDYGFASMKPTDLWGNIPMFNFYSPNDNFKPWKESIPRDPKKRALIPYGLSLALCKEIERDMEQV